MAGKRALAAGTVEISQRGCDARKNQRSAGCICTGFRAFRLRGRRGRGRLHGMAALDAPGPRSRVVVVHAVTGMRGAGKTHEPLGGESPLGDEVVLTPSRRQRRRREAGSGGSPRRNSAPRNTNRV